MKKFMFSAVALVAFSFAGMSSNNVKEKLDLKEEKTKVLVWNECDQLAEDVWNAYKKSGAGDDESYKASSDAYKSCIKRPSVSTSTN